MNGNVFRTLLCCLMFVTLISMNPLFAAFSGQINFRTQATVSVKFEVLDVYWGTYENPISPEPGDRNVPLTIVIQQYSSYYLRGVTGYLYLPNGFLDSHSQTNTSKASGVAIQTDSDAGDIKPYGTFYFTFYLDLSDSLTKGKYNMTLNISYYAVNGSIFLQGEPQLTQISVLIPNRAPEIYSVEPSNSRVTVYVGDNKTFSVVKAIDPDNDSLTYTWYLDGEKVGEGPNYTYIATREDFGTHTLKVEVSDGDLTTSNTWTIDVEIPRETKIVPSTDHVYAGQKTKITFCITNNLWHGSAHITIEVPEYVVTFGDTEWTINGLSPGDTVNVSITIYVPKSVITSYGEIQLIGQTLDITINLDYTDVHGNTYSESKSIGFIIRGTIVLRFFDISVEPEVAFPGDIIKISATVLNMGVATAQFCNASILPEPFIELLAESFVYIGDVEPNAPTPFTLQFRISPNVSFGEYIVTILFRYLDDMYDPQVITFNVSIQVVNIMENETTKPTQPSYYAYLPYLYAGLGTIAIALAVILIRRKRR